MNTSVEILNVIIVEDNELDSALLESKLKEKPGYYTKICTRKEELFSHLDIVKDTDVIILDDEVTNLKLNQSLTTIKRKSPVTEVIILSRNLPITPNIKSEVYASVIKDKTAVEKLLLLLENIRKNKNLKLENVALQAKAGRRQTSILVLVFVLAAIFAATIYFIFFKN